MADKEYRFKVKLTDGRVIPLGFVVPQGETGVGIADAKINSDGYLIITLTNNQQINAGLVEPKLPIASPGTLGGIRVGRNLSIDESGVLNVNTADEVEQDNTLPITSAAVHTTVGNIEELLKTI